MRNSNKFPRPLRENDLRAEGKRRSRAHLSRAGQDRARKRGKSEDASIVNTTVCKIDFLNQEINNKPKSVFYCPSYEKPEGRMCVFWDYTTISIGDTVRLKGRFNGYVFLVWDLQILKKGKKNEIQTQ